MRPIDADVLKEWFVAQIDHYKKYNGDNCNVMVSAYEAVLQRIDNEPTIEPADEQPTDSPDQITDQQICTGLIKLLLRRDPAGGILHIVLDDLNVEDDYIYLCALKIAKLVDQETKDNTIYLANTICMYLVDMSDAERLECIRNAKGN